MKLAKHTLALIVRTVAIGFVIVGAIGCNPGLGKITVTATRDFPEMGGVRPIAKYLSLIHI